MDYRELKLFFSFPFIVDFIYAPTNSFLLENVSFSATEDLKDAFGHSINKWAGHLITK